MTSQILAIGPGVVDRIAFGLSLLPGLGLTVVVVFVVALWLTWRTA